MKLYLSDSHDPYLNAAIEEELLIQYGEREELMMAFQNAPAVCIGRYQNPWCELNLKNINQDQIPILRRISGGGAVYHDLGNLNISVMGPDMSYDKERRMQPIVAHLKKQGIALQTTDRGDGLWDTFKVSGSAYKFKKGSSLHHFTLLCHADLERLWRYLRKEHPSSVESKAIQSRRSPVKNLDITHPMEWIQNFASQNGFEIVEASVQQKHRDRAEIFKSHAWTFLETPTFHYFDRMKKNKLIAEKGFWVQENDDRWESPVSLSQNLLKTDGVNILGDYDFSLFI